MKKSQEKPAVLTTSQAIYSFAEAVDGKTAFIEIIKWLYCKDYKFNSAAEWRVEFVNMLMKELKLNQD